MADPDDQPHYRAERIPDRAPPRRLSHRDHIDEAKSMLAQAVSRNPYATVTDLMAPPAVQADTAYVVATAAEVAAYDTVWLDATSVWRQVAALEDPAPDGQVGWFFFDDDGDTPAYRMNTVTAVYVIRAVPGE